MNTRQVMVVVVGLVAALTAGACSSSGTRPQGPPLPTRVEVSEHRERAIDALLELAKDPRPDVRANAVEALGLVPGRGGDTIGASLADPNTGVRTVAAQLVGTHKLEAHAGRLRVMLGDAASPYEQMSAIYALRAIGFEADPNPIAGYLLNAEEARVRAHAAFILGEMGNESARPLLREASVRSPARASPIATQLLRLQIAEALIKLGETDELSVIRAALYPARPDELEATALAVQILGEVQDRGAIDQLIFLTADSTDTDRPMPAEVRLAAAQSLARLGLPQGSFVATPYLDDPSAVRRAQAASVLGHTRRPENLRALVSLLDDESPIVRASAAAGIIRIAER